MKATRADVAKLAGVSSATVSNVLNDASKVKDETAARVLDAIRRLDYRPNMVARSLNTKKTMQIGIVLENIRNPYYGELVEHFEAAARARGYFVNICTGMNNLDNYLDNFISRGVDGAFVAALPYKFNMDKLYSLTEHGIRLLVSGNTGADIARVSSIENDYVRAMRAAIEHLAALGHERIAYLSGLGRELSYDERCGAYLATMRETGLLDGGRLSDADSLLVDGVYPYATDERGGYELATRLLASGQAFTAAICSNDLMAIGAMRAFHEAGLRVPRDVSVMGFDGIALGGYLSPTLTTMAVEAKLFGEKSFELLYAGMVSNENGCFLNPLKLIRGESTARRP